MLEKLVELSNRYGSDPDFVLAGGGNSSLKKEGILYVKASGIPMASIDESGFAGMDISRLERIWETEYPEDAEERERKALEDLMQARLAGENKRPSVETLLHSFIPFRYVMHTHPALVNALTCSVDGERIAAEIWGENMLWIPVVNPGYYLARYVRDRIDELLSEKKGFPDYIFLQNHGVFTGGESADEVDQRYEQLLAGLKSRITENFIPGVREISGSESETLKGIINRFYGSEETGFIYMSVDDNSIVSSRESAGVLFKSLTPDHIVYMGGEPLWVPETDDESTDVLPVDTLESYERQHLKKPRVILRQNRGIICCGRNHGVAENARMLLLDALRITRLSEYFGGVQFMPEDKADFIKSWEVENYRESLSR